MKTRTMMGLAAVVALLLVTGASRAEVIYQDTFDRTDAALNGDSINTATGFTGTGGYGGSATATWWAAPGFTTDGTTAHSGGGGKAFLPFTPQAGFVYTLSVVLEDVSANKWTAVGFATVNFGNTPNSNSFQAHPISTRSRLRTY